MDLDAEEAAEAVGAAGGRAADRGVGGGGAAVGGGHVDGVDVAIEEVGGIERGLIGGEVDVAEAGLEDRAEDRGVDGLRRSGAGGKTATGVGAHGAGVDGVVPEGNVAGAVDVVDGVDAPGAEADVTLQEGSGEEATGTRLVGQAIGRADNGVEGDVVGVIGVAGAHHSSGCAVNGDDGVAVGVVRTWCWVTVDETRGDESEGSVGDLAEVVGVGEGEVGRAATGDELHAGSVGRADRSRGQERLVPGELDSVDERVVEAGQGVRAVGGGRRRGGGAIRSCRRHRHTSPASLAGIGCAVVVEISNNRARNGCGCRSRRDNRHHDGQ